MQGKNRRQKYLKHRCYKKKQNEKRDRKNVLKKLERMGEHFCITAVRKKKKEEK